MVAKRRYVDTPKTKSGGGPPENATPPLHAPRLGVKLLEIAITIVYAVVMIDVVLPWVVQSLSDTHVRSIEQSR